VAVAAGGESRPQSAGGRADQSAATSVRVRDRARRAMRWLLTKEVDLLRDDAATNSLRTLRRRVAAGIVVVSVMSAFAAWRSSVHDEYGSQHDAEYRQDLVLLQQAERSTEEQIAQEVSLFGSYEEHAVQARSMSSEARRARADADTQLASRLALASQAESSIANAQQFGFQDGYPQRTRAGYTYNPQTAYEFAASGDLASAQHRPAEQRRLATAEHRTGVHLEGIAALFIAALVLLTFAEVVGAGQDRTDGRIPVGATRMFAASGVTVALVASALFLMVGR
jgi:hypothetical protein